MTTIAYKDYIVSYDSRLTKGDIILDDKYEKIKVVSDNYFFYSGCPSDVSILINGFLNNDDEISKDKKFIVNCEALVMDSAGDIWNCSFTEENQFWKVEIDKSKYIAIGSGCQYALTAMDCGHSSYKAVEYSMKRDIYTGGQIRLFDIRKFKTIKEDYVYDSL